MKTSYRGISAAAVSLLLLVGVVASTDDSLTRVADYKQWSKATQDIPLTNLNLDAASVGG